MAENKSISPCNNDQPKSPDHCLLNSDIAKGEPGWAYLSIYSVGLPKVYITLATQDGEFEEQYNTAKYPF